MNTFAKAASNQTAFTENNMKARKSTSSACVDLFYNIGAMRGKDIVPSFTAAFVENADLACRIALWARDVRQGAGERQIFKNILSYLDKNGHTDHAQALMNRVPELGRWDDLLIDLQNQELRNHTFTMISDAIKNGDGLCAKWMPRKGDAAIALRNFMGMSPKCYRKTLVNLTKVVETQMCAKDWDNINYNHVPSLAASRYKKAFTRHSDKYKEYVAKLVSTDPKVRSEVKINAGAVYPYDVLKGKISHYYNAKFGKTELDAISAQWDALPNYTNGQNVLPLVDVSGSMTANVGGNKNLTCLDVSVSLGLYCADKNTGPFKDMFLTFSVKPELLTLNGNIIQKIDQMANSNWTMGTNLHAAIKKILDVAIQGSVASDDMPKMLLIMSDMQFNQCVKFDDSAIEMIRRKYEEAGYQMPVIVFWNLRATDNVPVKHDESDIVLVSGFSPSILKSILSANFEDFTPTARMMKTIMQERYNF